MKDIIQAVLRKVLSNYLANDNKLDSISRYENDFSAKFSHDYEVYDMYIKYFWDPDNGFKNRDKINEYYKYLDDIIRDITGYTSYRLYKKYRNLERDEVAKLLSRIEILSKDESFIRKISGYELFKNLKGKQLEKAIKNLLKLCIKGKVEDKLDEVILSIFIENINVGSYYLELAREVAFEK